MFLQFNSATTDLTLTPGAASGDDPPAGKDAGVFGLLLGAERLHRAIVLPESGSRLPESGKVLPPATDVAPGIEPAAGAADDAGQAPLSLPFVALCPQEPPVAGPPAKTAGGAGGSARPDTSLPDVPIELERVAPAAGAIAVDTPAPAAGTAMPAVPVAAAMPDVPVTPAMPAAAHVPTPPAAADVPRSPAATAAPAPAELAAAAAPATVPAATGTGAPVSRVVADATRPSDHERRPAPSHRLPGNALQPVPEAAAVADRDLPPGQERPAGDRAASGPVAVPDFELLAPRPDRHSELAEAGARALQAAPSGALAASGPVGPQAPATPAPVAVPAPINVPVDDADWGQAVGDRVLWMAGQKIQSAEVRLNPAELGPLTVSVKVEDQSAHLHITAHHALTRDALEQALPRLRDMFAAEGMTLASAHVGDQGVKHGQGEGGSAASPFAGDDGLAAGAGHEPELPALSQKLPLGLVDTYA